MNLFEETERIKSLGYNEENAQSKLGQDIILKAIADSGMARNATDSFNYSKIYWSIIHQFHPEFLQSIYPNYSE